MKPFYALVNAVHREMYEQTVLNVLITKTLCSNLEVRLGIMIIILE